MKILVTGAGALLGQGIIRSLRWSSIDTEIIAVDPSPLSAGLYWADRHHLVPMAADPEYMDRIRAILNQERPDAVLVGTDVELSLFAEHRRALEQEFNTHVLVSSPEVIEIADDKYKTFLFMRDGGFAYPDSVLADDAADLVERVGFPLIVKPRVGARSVGVHLVDDSTALSAALKAEESVVVQELAGPPDREYTAGVVCFDGSCKASIVMRRDLRDGNTYRAYVEHDEALENTVRKMGAALNPYGPANFQFRVDESGAIKVFEINARFSGTTPLRAKAGFNEVEMCLQYLVNSTPVEQPQTKPLVFLRHWSETELPSDELLPQ